MNRENTINATPEEVAFYHADGTIEYFQKSEYTCKFMQHHRTVSVHIPANFQYPYIIAPVLTGIEGLPYTRDPQVTLIVSPSIGEYLARAENSHVWSGMVIGVDPAQIVKTEAMIIGTRGWIIYKGVTTYN